MKEIFDTNKHGTRCAGQVAAMANNSLCSGTSSNIFLSLPTNSYFFFSVCFQEFVFAGPSEILLNFPIRQLLKLVGQHLKYI